MIGRTTLVGLLCLITVTSGALGQSTATLHVSIAGAADRTFTLAQLQEMGMDSASGRFHAGPDHTFVGISLGHVLAAAGRPVDSLRGRDLSQVVLVEAADGYRVVFALAELDPSFRGAERPPVLLVWAEDGAPVASEYGPLRLVVPAERRPSRWIRQVTRVSVFPVPSAPAKP